MQGIDGTFWVGLALAIPMSIIGNLLTPRFQAWIARRSEAAAAKRKRETAAERERIEGYIAKPQRLYTYLLGVVLATTLITSLFGILAGAFFLAGTVELHSSFLRAENVALQSSFYAAGQVIVIFGGVLVAKLCVDAMRVISKVRSSGG